MSLLWSIPMTTFALGTWQLYRLKWKLELIENAQLGFASLPIPIQDAE